MAPEFSHHIQWLAEFQESLRGNDPIPDEIRQKILRTCYQILLQNPESNLAKQMQAKLMADPSEFLDSSLQLLWGKFLNQETCSMREFESILRAISMDGISAEVRFASIAILQYFGAWNDTIQNTAIDTSNEIPRSEFLDTKYSVRTRLVAGIELINMNKCTRENKRILLESARTYLENADNPITTYLAERIICYLSNDVSELQKILQRNQEVKTIYIGLLICALNRLPISKVIEHAKMLEKEKYIDGTFDPNIAIAQARCVQSICEHILNDQNNDEEELKELDDEIFAEESDKPDDENYDQGWQGELGDWDHQQEFNINDDDFTSIQREAGRIDLEVFLSNIEKKSIEFQYFAWAMRIIHKISESPLNGKGLAIANASVAFLFWEQKKDENAIRFLQEAIRNANTIAHPNAYWIQKISEYEDTLAKWQEESDNEDEDESDDADEDEDGV